MTALKPGLREAFVSDIHLRQADPDGKDIGTAVKEFVTAIGDPAIKQGLLNQGLGSGSGLTLIAGTTPLDFARQIGHIQTYETLKKFGAQETEQERIRNQKTAPSGPQAGSSSSNNTESAKGLLGKVGGFFKNEEQLFKSKVIITHSNDPKESEVKITPQSKK